MIERVIAASLAVLFLILGVFLFRPHWIAALLARAAP